jgi:hypothetical protein
MGRANSNTIDHPEIVGNETIQDEEQATPSTVPNHFSSWTPFFMSVMAFIGGVSAYDGYLVVRTGPIIREFEKNPIGLYLIDCDDGDADLFLRVKAAGTLLTLTALSVLNRHSRRLASPVALALVVFQGGLLLFLENPFS